jgi:hypothetical protein
VPQVALLLQEEAVSRVPLWLQVVREAGQAFQAWVTPFLLVAGRFFAYYRFRRSRTFHRRLKVEVAGRVERATGLSGAEGLLYLVVTTAVTNIGDREVTVDDTLLLLESPDSPPETARPPWVAGWSDLLSESGIVLGLEAFEEVRGGGRTLEPEEPVEDRALIGIPDVGYGAIRVTAKEWRRKKDATRRFLEELRNSEQHPGWSFQERPNGSEDDAGTTDL